MAVEPHSEAIWGLDDRIRKAFEIESLVPVATILRNNRLHWETEELVKGLDSLEYSLNRVYRLSFKDIPEWESLGLQKVGELCQETFHAFGKKTSEYQRENQNGSQEEQGWTAIYYRLSEEGDVDRFVNGLVETTERLELLLSRSSMQKAQGVTAPNNQDTPIYSNRYSLVAAIHYQVYASHKELQKGGYRYRRLDYENYEIRILTIVTDSDTQNVSATIEHTSLFDAGAYTSLSYCWGDSNITTPILIDGIQMEVTVNLKAALLQLRARGYHRLWIDAICINQADREERSLQVRNMRQIFSRADQVACWVGDSSSSVAEAARTIFLSNSRSPSDIAVLTDFFTRPYWNRVWVIQEVAVAADVKIIFGSVEIPWPRISSLLESRKQNEQMEPFLEGALTLSHFRHNLSISHQSIGLHQALERSSKFLATDIRDKIFALLGVSHDGPTLVPLPNYKQSLDRILTDMTVAIIREDRSLEIIVLKGSGPVPNELRPSWVPDWLHLWDPTQQVSDLEAHYHDWRKSYSRNPVLRKIDERSILVRGVFLDAISALSAETNTLLEQLFTGATDTLSPQGGDGMKWIWTGRRYLGMAHLNAREGDQVMYIQGCSVPVILREISRGKENTRAFFVVGGTTVQMVETTRQMQLANFDARCKFFQTGLWEKRDEVEEIILC